jgi:hypothetical protein
VVLKSVPQLASHPASTGKIAPDISLTLLGSLSARETVMVDTPARLATSRIRAL